MRNLIHYLLLLTTIWGLSATTIFGQNCPATINISSNTTPNGTTVTWDANAAAQQYELRYREVGTSALSYATTNTNSFTFTNLQPNICYEFAVRTLCDSVNAGPWSPGQSFCVPGSSGFCAQPSNIASNTSPNSASLTWTAVQGAQFYEIRYREVGTSALSFATSTTNSLTLTGLMASTCYEFAMRTSCDTANFSPWTSPAQRFCTDPPAQSCPVPSNVSAAPSAGSVLLTWTAITNAIGYEIRYRPVGTSALTYVSVPANRAVINNLMANTCYEYSVRTQCDSNTYSAWLIPAQSFCVPGSAGLCLTPTNITSSTTTNTTVLSWMPMNNAIAYEIRYREVGTSALTYVTTNSSTATLGNLMAGTCYEFSIRTQCDTNSFSPWLIPAQQFCTDAVSTPCNIPSGITVSTSTNDAVINWMAEPNALGYEIRYRQVGTSALTYVNVPANRAVLQNLMANTCYEFSIRTQCDTNTYSDWLIPALSFCTDSNTTVPCPVPTGADADSVTTNLAFLSWNSASTSVGYEVRYGVPGTIMSDTIFTSSPSTVLQNLMPGTCYNFEVRTLCSPNSSTSVSAWSTPVTFCTDSVTVPPCTTPMGAQTDSVTTNLAFLSWMSTGTNFGYEVRYEMIGNPVGDTVFTNSSSITLQNLMPGTCYNFIVRSICNSNGNSSAWSTPVTFCTDSIVVPPCPVPTNVQADSVTTTLAFVSWTGNPTNFGYEVRYAVPGTPYTTMTVGVNTSTVLQNLMPGTCYNFGVRTICNPTTGNFSAWSNDIVFCTDSVTVPPCPTPMGAQTDSVTTNLAFLSWMSNGTNFGYEVRYSVPGTTMPGDTIFTNSSSTVLQNLMAGTCYTFNVRTICDPASGDVSAWSAPVTFCTDSVTSAPCFPPRNTFTVMNATFGSFNWDAVAGATGYEVRFRVLNDTAPYTVLFSSDTTRFYQGFMPSTCYEYNVRTKCDTVFNGTNMVINYSQWSAQDTFCTPSMMVNPNGNTNATDAFQTIGNGDNNSLRYNMFPNPTTGAVTIKFERDLNPDYNVRVFNVLGAEVTPMALERGAATCTFNLSHLTNGLYLIEISTDKQRLTQRVQVSK